MTFLSLGFFVTLGLFLLLLLLFSLWGVFIDGIINGIRNQSNEKKRKVKKLYQQVKENHVINEMINTDSITKIS